MNGFSSGTVFPRMTMNISAWRIAVDTGGTFTDAIAIDPDGAMHRAKLLSTGRLRGRIVSVDGRRSCTLDLALPRDSRALLGARMRLMDDDAGSILTITEHRGQRLDLDAGPPDVGRTVEISTDEPAPVLAARLLTNTSIDASFPSLTLRLATTRGTNALLERTMARTALFVTKGFRDVLRIDDQRRAELFTLTPGRPDPLTTDVWPIAGRLDAEGKEVEPLDEDDVHRAARAARAAGCTVAAIALLHSWANDAHERAVESIVHDAGFDVVRRSSIVSPGIHLLRRTQTTVVDAGLTPIVGSFIDSIGDAIGGDDIRIMTSAGGVVRRDDIRPSDTLLSGPAGGVVGAARAGRLHRETTLISFDMGGTSTDVARIDGVPMITFRHQVGDARVARPAIAIETVAAGGGSICRFVNGRPHVGPASAGASPGPACYGMGGPLTMTDVNVLLGFVDTTNFEIPMSTEAAERALDRVLDDAATQLRRRPPRDEVLRGFRDLADERMAEAIRRVSVRRGFDPAVHTLFAFGGAGPQHAAALADRLGMQRIIVPPDASLLSALGVQAAAIERLAERSLLQPLDNVVDEIDDQLRELEREARAAMMHERGTDEHDRMVRIVSLRFTGQEHAIDLHDVNVEDLDTEFRTAYEHLYRHHPEDRQIECVSLRIIVRRPSEMTDESVDDTALHWTHGPTCIADRRTTTVVPEGWRAARTSHGGLRLERDATPSAAAMTMMDDDQTVMANELIMTRLAAIAEEMGEQLRQTAISPNIRDRLDYSCGVLDADGRLVASAPHIPVHLGALGPCVRAVNEALGELRPDDVAITNHPRDGGSHLPDVTVVQAVFDASGERRLGYVASRAHHAEIGGMTPGSMPPAARSLSDEGVIIPAMKLIDAGVPQWDRLRDMFTAAPYPTRALSDNLTDIGAALAAGAHGAARLRDLCASRRADRVHRAMQWIIEHTAELVRDGLRDIVDAPEPIVETLDDGSEIHIALACTDDGLRLDLRGSSPQHPTNFNAPRAVMRSAVAYVVRLLVAKDIPLNEGLLDAIDIVTDERSIIDPHFEGDASTMPAVAAGNVETSQRLVNALIRALGLAADSQGTMNNLLMGNDTFGAYETIGGGAGATRDHDGASGIHTHMTNTAMTDAEILERRYPLRVLDFALRAASGGSGRHVGGDGLVREIEALADVDVSVIGQHRTTGPSGLDGGEAGRPALQRVLRRDGMIDDLDSSASVRLVAGDRIRIETPGGGGVGC